MAGLIGIEEKLEYQKEVTWGVNPGGVAATWTGVELEGGGYNVAASRVNVDLVTSLKTPKHGTQRQLITGFNIEGDFNAILNTANAPGIIGLGLRNAGTGKLQSLTFRHQKGTIEDSTEHNGCKVNSLNVSGSAGDVVRAVLSILGKKEVDTTTFIGGAIPSSGISYIHTTCHVKVGGVFVTKLGDWSFSVENNVELGPHRLNVKEIVYAEEGGQSASGEFTALFETATNFQKTQIRADTVAEIVYILDDVGDAEGTPTGTLATITFPVAHILSASKDGDMGSIQQVRVSWVAGADVNGDIVLLT